MMDGYDDLTFAVELLNRATTLRCELGPEAYRRGMRRALVALGDAAIDEAERRARPLARHHIGAVVPFTGRRRRAGALRGGPERIPERADSARPATENADPEGPKRVLNHEFDRKICARTPQIDNFSEGSEISESKHGRVLTALSCIRRGSEKLADPTPGATGFRRLQERDLRETGTQ